MKDRITVSQLATKLDNAIEDKSSSVYVRPYYGSYSYEVASVKVLKTKVVVVAGEIRCGMTPEQIEDALGCAGATLPIEVKFKNKEHKPFFAIKVENGCTGAVYLKAY